MASGTIRLNVPKLAELETSVKSGSEVCPDHTEHCRRLVVKCLGTGNVKQLTVFVNCNSGENTDTKWRCKSTVTFTILAQKGHAPYSETFSRTFKFKEDYKDYTSSIDWDDVLNPEKGFIREDGGIVVEASITVKDVNGAPLYSTPLYDFSAPQPNITDVILLIGDKLLHVGKQFLSTFSPLFYEMFYKDPDEKDKEEIKLDNVVFEEFVELLHVIYPTRKQVTAKTVECLLRLGDKFKVEVVVRECANFLCGPESNGIPLKKKLLYSDKYSLMRVQYFCLDSLKTVEVVVLLSRKFENVEFSNEMKAALFERICQLTCYEASQCP